MQKIPNKTTIFAPIISSSPVSPTILFNGFMLKNTARGPLLQYHESLCGQSLPQKAKYRIAPSNNRL